MFVVFADDLPKTDSVLATLRQAFGAQPGDWVVDARGGPSPTGHVRPIGYAGADIFPTRLAAAC